MSKSGTVPLREASHHTREKKAQMMDSFAFLITSSNVFFSFGAEDEGDLDRFLL